MNMFGQKKYFDAWVKKCQMYSFEVVNKSKMAHAISKILFILGSNKILACLEHIRSYAWSFDHSDPDLSSVSNYLKSFHEKKGLFSF